MISEGLVCRHFFQVMLRTQNAKFAIALVKNRWYKKSIDAQIIHTIYDSEYIIRMLILQILCMRFKILDKIV